MIITTSNSEFAFAFQSNKASFAAESPDRVIAVLPLPNGERVPVSLRCPAGQYQLEAHPPFKIDGDVTWSAYETLVELPDVCFGLWIDPLDGETKYCEALREKTTDELDRVLDNVVACFEKSWDDLKHFHQKAQSEKGERERGSDGLSGLGKLLSSSLFGGD